MEDLTCALGTGLAIYAGGSVLRVAPAIVHRGIALLPLLGAKNHDEAATGLFWAATGGALKAGPQAAEVELTTAANGGGPARYPNFSWGGPNFPPRALGATDKFGNITLRPGLTGNAFSETLRHEGVHSFLSPMPGGALQTARADLRMWGYNNSTLLRYTEEAIAETYATKSLSKGLQFPLLGGYKISPLRLSVEGALFGGALVGPTAGAYFYSQKKE
jgi:hypothetical protein